MICNRTKLLVDTPLYMRIRVSFAAGERVFFERLSGRVPVSSDGSSFKGVSENKSFCGQTRSFSYTLFKALINPPAMRERSL
jgi:hypothetical protein